MHTAMRFRKCRLSERRGREKPPLVGKIRVEESAAGGEVMLFAN